MNIIDSLKNGLIVSCQALEHEPLHSPYIMAKMAKAAELGGAVAIRANGFKDIRKIKETVSIPVIGLIKKHYKNFTPYITPSVNEVEKIVAAGADIVALDATVSLKPGNLTTGEILSRIKTLFPSITLMADISTYKEGIEASRLGFDLVSTTLSGYTSYSTKSDLPDFKLIQSLSKELDTPVIAEGRIWYPEQAAKAFELGAYAVVVGTAITRPQEITRHFLQALKK